ncbi:PAS domain-containing protein [Temperatibacter marinus]|uniref:PAS domain-containing protein n=1 Tax=Temperatibacter marinus TaxID=1456591 RepID=A0AA52EAP4_9PROT|nr:PAS domain-containing protein [Temperatibacter marinus]WND01366.1 PAS domain-containing protein [Temperatibacter marinus]
MQVSEVFLGNQHIAQHLLNFIRGWNSNPDHYIIPPYLNFSPMSLKELLAHTSILEMDKAGGIFFRLCGSEIEKIYGRSLTNTYMSDLYDDLSEAECLNEIYAQAIIQGCGLIKISVKHFIGNTSSYPMLKLCLPMSHPRSLGGNLLLCLSVYPRPSSSGLEMQNTTKLANDKWLNLSYLNFYDNFKTSMMSRRSKLTFEAKNLNVETINFDHFTDLAEEISEELPTSTPAAVAFEDTHLFA